MTGELRGGTSTLGKPARGPRRWLAPLVVGAVCLGGVAGSFGQSSASPAGLPVVAKPAAAVAAPRHSKKLPDTPALLSGVVALATAARDTRSKINVQVPAVDGVAYLDPTYRTPASQTITVPKYDLPKHPIGGCTYSAGILYADLYAVRIKQPNKSKPGVVTSVGRFPDAHVSALAFGSIPVTATLHTRQIRRHGKLQPLTADTITSFTSTPLRNGGPCDPSWDAGAQTPPYGTISHGQLTVRVSDVEVDHQAIDVGPHCRTVSPLDLNLFGSPGYLAYVGGQLTEKYDPTTVNNGGSVYPLHPHSSNLTIPAFTGCVNPHTGEDVSRLLTAMVSGTANTVAVNQSTAILNGITSKDPTKCAAGQGCVKTPTFVRPPKPGMRVHLRHH